MREIAVGSVEKVLEMVENPEHSQGIKRASFLSALDGIRTGVMTYKDDPILPAIEAEIATRLERFKGLTKEQETELFALTDEHRKTLSVNDKRMTNEFLQAPPAISHGSIKMHDKYKHYVKMAHDATR